MKCRVVYKPDGTVAVIHYAPKSRRSYEDAMARAMTQFPGCEYDDIDVSELPQTREDRAAWRGEKGVGVRVDAGAKAAQDAEKRVAQKLEAYKLRAARTEVEASADPDRQTILDKIDAQLAELPQVDRVR